MITEGEMCIQRLKNLERRTSEMKADKKKQQSNKKESERKKIDWPLFFTTHKHFEITLRGTEWRPFFMGPKLALALFIYNMKKSEFTFVCIPKTISRDASAPPPSPFADSSGTADQIQR